MKKEYITTELQIDGMRCGMCETHVNDIVRRNFKVKKVKSSHCTGKLVILSEDKIDLDKLEASLKEMGYYIIK